MGGKNFAWVVVIRNGEQLQRALISGETLRKTKSSAPIFALVAKSVLDSETSSKLENIFEAVMVTDSIRDGERDIASAQVVSLMKLTIFSKILVLQPGVLVLEQSDYLFDVGNKNDLILTNEDSNDWSILRITPSLSKYNSSIEGLTNEYNWEKLCKTLFGRKWRKLIQGNVIRSLGNRQHKIVELETSWNGKYPEAIKDFMEAPVVLMEDTKDWVAVVGMSCRFPEADSLEEYWNLLKNGLNTSSTPPDHRLKLTQNSKLDPNVRGNFLKCPIDQFDASFFGMSPAEACLTDPQTRLLLEVSWEAFENAGINPDKLRATPAGVFYGSWVQEFKEALNHESSPPKDDYVRKYLANSFGSTASKLSFFYGLTGPNVATESGCSSSMVAVDLACKSLRRRECPVALAAGANIIVHLNMKQKVVWSEDAICKTFDANPTGYGRSEGVAVLVLKRYSDALKDQDRIHGIIRGTWTSQEGLSRSFGTPTTESEAEAMMGALAEAKVDPSEVSYVEAHATGTGVGDPIEAAAIVQVYSSDTEREKPLIIGSGKTNIGHTESCSGMAGIIKVLLAMKHEMIPPHINMKSLNPAIDFSKIPGTIPIESVEWRRDPKGPRIAGVSSFGITGTDVHVIIEEPPKQNTMKTTKSIRIPQIISWSAKSEAALEALTNSYIQYLEVEEKIDLSSIAYTMNACRAHHVFRRAIVIPEGTATNDLISQIKKGRIFNGKVKSQKPKICFTFPPGRTDGVNWEPAKVLYNSNLFFKTAFDEANSIFESLSGTSILPVFLNETSSSNEPEIKCVEWFACTLSVQYALVKLLESYGITPNCVIGHCLGEVGAAVVSGALSLENGFKVIMASKNFAQSQQRNPAEMMAIAAGESKLKS